MNWRAFLAIPHSREYPSEGPRYAAFRDRLFASSLDTLLLFMLLLGVFVDLERWVHEVMDAPRMAMVVMQHQGAGDVSGLSQSLAESGSLDAFLVNMALQLLIIGLCFVGMWWQFNTTPGKWLLGLKIVDAETLEEPSTKQYIIRFLGFFVSLPPFLLGFMAIGWSKRKQSWHDRLAGTVVIHTRKTLKEWLEERHNRRMQKRAAQAAGAQEQAQEQAQEHAQTSNAEAPVEVVSGDSERKG